jgi:hypothetical protein
MSRTFEEVVEIVRDLPTDEKEEIKFIIEKTIVEKRRGEIYKNYLKSKQKQKDGKLHFTNKINELKKMLG